MLGIDNSGRHYSCFWGGCRLSDSCLEKISDQTKLHPCFRIKWKIYTKENSSIFLIMELSNLIANYELPIQKGSKP